MMEVVKQKWRRKKNVMSKYTWNKTSVSICKNSTKNQCYLWVTLNNGTSSGNSYFVQAEKSVVERYCLTVKCITAWIKVQCCEVLLDVLPFPLQYLWRSSFLFSDLSNSVKLQTFSWISLLAAFLSIVVFTMKIDSIRILCQVYPFFLHYCVILSAAVQFYKDGVLKQSAYWNGELQHVGHGMNAGSTYSVKFRVLPCGALYSSLTVTTLRATTVLETSKPTSSNAFFPLPNTKGR